MTGKEVAKMALNQVEPPRVPVTLVAGGEWYVHFSGETFAGIINDSRRIADVFVRAFREIGHDLMWTGAGLLNYPAHFLGCPIQDNSSTTPALTGTAIESLADLNSLSVDMVVNHPTMKTIIEAHHLIADDIGPETLILPTQWGPFTTAARILGTEKLMMATIENPERLMDLITLTTEINWAVFERIMAHPDIPGLNLSEPMSSGDMISPAMFRKFSAPFLKDLVGRAKNGKKYSMIHICGNATSLLPDVVDIGPDCFSVEAKVDLKAAKEVLGGKVCVAGNVSPTGAFLSGKPEEVIQEARACLEAWGNNPGFILTVGCDFPKEVPFENVKALMSLKSEAA